MKGSAADRTELAALLTLFVLPGLSQSSIARSLARHGCAHAALRALRHDAPDAVVQAARTDAVRRRVHEALHALDAMDAHVVAMHDDAYPQRMRDRLGTQLPPALFALGDPALLERTGIAVVGCRDATPYGCSVAASIAQGVASAGGCVTSGLARGIDAAAHTAALEAGGATIAVLGCGIDVLYPRSNAPLQRRIVREGLILSEHLPGTPPLRHHFTHRNRIIAALSEVVVIVEAGARSGAVSTAQHAADAGVPVQCVMNAMHLPNVQGIIGLLRDGAPVYTGVEDLLSLAGLEPSAAPVNPPPALPPGTAPVFAAIPPEAIHVDDLSRALDVEPGDLWAALLELELAGHIRSLPGQRFTRS